MSSISKLRDFEPSGKAVNWHDLSKREQENLKEHVFKSIIIGDLEMVKNILSGYSGINMNFWMHNPKKDGDNPLHLAAFNGHLHIVEFLMENNRCHSNWNNKYKNKPLHRAAAKGRLNVVKYLVEKQNCDPMSKCNYEQTPLHMACQYNHLEVVRYLATLENVYINAQNNQGQTPLHLACQNNYVEVVECLMDIEGINQDVKSNWGLTPLERAKESGAREVVKYMTKSSARVGKLDISLDQKESLFEATISGNLEKIKEIIGYLSGNMNGLRYNNKHRDNPLHLAARNGHIEVVKYLIESFYCESECRDIHYNTPLHRAARGGNLDVVKYLIEEQYCNPMCLCHWGRTPLHMACDHSHINVVKYLMNRVDVDKNAKNNRGLTPLDLAAQRGSVETVKYMIEEKKSYDSRDYFGYNTPLHLAAYRGNLEVVKYLVEEARFDVNIEGYHSTTPLHSASYGEQMPVFKYLIETEKVKSSNDLTPLGIAAEHGTFEMVKYMVEDRNFPLQYSSSMYTPLHHAARGGKFESVKYFIESKGYDADCKGLKSRTPLHSACLTAMDYSNENYDKLKRGKYDTVEYLVYNCRANPSCQDDEGNTPLHTAVKSGEMSLVQLLVTQSQKELFMFDQLNRLPVSLAETGGHTAMLQYLEKAKQVYFDSSRKILKKCFSSLTKAVPASTSVDLYGEERFGTILEFRIPSSIRNHNIAGKFLKIDCNDSLDKTASLIDERVTIICKLSHPNILQNFGLCLVPDEIMPVFLMENIKASLRMYFNLSLSDMQRMNILCGVASGLSYLHSQPTPFVHGHLTADNVLIDTILIAKIGGFDIVCNPSIAKDTEYDPPEAQGSGTRSDPSVDVFSFGHLCLATLLQKEVQPLLPSQFVNEANEPSVRLEVDRRSTFLEEAKQLLGPNNTIIDTIKRCLRNVPTQRPRIEQLDLHSSESSTTYNPEARYSETGRALGADIVSPKLQDKISEEDKKLFTEAMSHGYIESAIPLIIFMGVAGSGKSEFKRLVLDQEVPEFSPSTPLAESAVRSMSVCQVAVDDKDDDDDDVEWTIVGPQEMVSEVAAKMKSKAEEHLKQSSSSQSVSQSAPVDNDKCQKEIPTPPSSHDTTSESDSQRFVKEKEHKVDESHTGNDKHSDNLNPAFLEALEKITIEKDLLDSMNKLSEVTTDKQLMGVNFIFLLDSGGQPAFREMLPHFVQQASAIVLMQKLNERLDFRPTIRYREEEGKVDKGYPSQYTNEQILHQYVQGVQSHESKVFVIGTHRDKEGDCKDETKEEKDEKLLETFGPVHCKEWYKVPDQLIFPVNCTSRELDDKAIGKEFRKRVMEKCMKKKEKEKNKIPLPWFILEQLLKSLAQEMKVSVLSVDQCCEAAQQKLHMSPEDCNAALRYLGRLNIIFYRPDILPGVMFSSAQVILDKITELVRCNHALRTKEGSSDVVPSYMHCDDGKKFEQLGLLDSELLENSFHSHYREDLFTSPDFLLLLERMLIAGRLNTGEHFIPSLLPDLPVEKIAEYRATAGHPPPLVIYYPKKWLPVGVMSSLVVYLQNQCQWELSKERSYHNCFLFDLPRGKPGDLVLIDSIEFLELHVRSTCKLPAAIFQEIKCYILTGLKEAHTSLHYNPPDVKLGFLCSCERGETNTHFATPDGDKVLWKCSKNNKMGGNLCKKQKLWLEDSSEDEPLDTGCVNNATNHTPIEDFSEVKSVLQPVKERWQEIGVVLGLDLGTLKKWRRNCEENHDEYLEKMLSLWENKKYNTEIFGKPSWELLARAVGDSAGGDDPTLAEKITNTHVVSVSGISDSTAVGTCRLPNHEQESHTNDPKGEASREYPEITRLRENLTLITTTVTAGGSPQHFANKLVEKAFLPQHTAQQILDTPGLAPDRQASKLMDSVFARIEHSERKDKLFKDFVDIFSSEPAYEDLVKKLRGTDTAP